MRVDIVCVLPTSGLALYEQVCVLRMDVPRLVV